MSFLDDEDPPKQPRQKRPFVPPEERKKQTQESEEGRGEGKEKRRRGRDKEKAKKVE